VAATLSSTDALPSGVTIGVPGMPISVIVPTRDTRDLTLRCLAALAGSVQPAAEILVIDDASRDGTAEAIRAAFPHTRLLRHDVAQGFTGSINAAWPLATGAIVLLLNSDTEVQPHALTAISDAFSRDPRLGIAGATLRYPDGRLQWSAGREPTPLWLFVMSSGLSSSLGRLPGWRRVRPESQATGDVAWVPATAMAVRREVQQTIGLFDPDLSLYAQDLDYCVRARAAGWRVAQLTEAVVHHVGGATITGASTSLRQDPAALYADLARWLHKSHDPIAARRATRALRAGCRARVVARDLLRWFYGSTARAAWDGDTARYRDALTRIGGS
jgi:GT2 family glycosyltransferase